MTVHHPILDLETLLRVPYVEPDMGFDLSPVGREVAFSWNPSGQWEIYVVAMDGPGAPRQITSGAGAKFAPRWSPDGSRLAYVLDLDGGENYDLYVYDLRTSRHSNLTPDTPFALQPNYAWSPSGGQIAIISDRGGRFDTYLLSLTGAHTRRVLSVTYPDWEVDWSPDGHWLAVVVEGEGQDHWTFLVPAQGGEPLQISQAGQPLCAKGTRWSPDSAHLAFASDAAGDFNLGLYELATGHISWLTAGTGDKGGPAWSPGARRLAYVTAEGASSALSILDLETGSSTHHRVAPGVHYRPKFTPDGEQIVFVFDDPAHPCDLWRLVLSDGTLHPVTRSLPPALADAPFALPEEIRYPGLDGAPVPALLYQPHWQASTTARGGSAVVYVHGGPNWLTQVTWDPLVQHMVSRGWVVLAPNYRGSTGYGRAWQHASRFDLGGVDTQDVVAGADYLVDEGLADAARIAVTGRSWGGYLTMTCLTQYPDRWAAGSAVVPFLNWFTSHANSREDLQHWDRENFGDPDKDRDLWRERSPFFFLHRIQAPVQLISGVHDVRCPASEALQARDELVALGKVCDLVLYEDEGHSFLKIDNVLDAKKRRLAFLAGVLESGLDQDHVT
ncbi:MAG: S9 family peptidase [Anaerolineae bacterium]